MGVLPNNCTFEWGTFWDPQIMRMFARLMIQLEVYTWVVCHLFWPRIHLEEHQMLPNR